MKNTNLFKSLLGIYKAPIPTDLFVREHYYFVIDSRNLNEVESRLYGYCVADGHLVLDYEDMKGGASRVDAGRYVLVERDEDVISIRQDLMGSYGLYLYKKDDYWAISNSFLYLVDYLKSKHQLSLNKAYADAFLLEYLVPIVYGQTMINEIQWLDRHVLVSIDIPSKMLKMDLLPFQEKLVPIDTQEGMDLLDGWYEKWGGLIRNAISDLPGGIESHLSGGMDSRMVFTLLLHQAVDTARISLFSKDDALRNHPEDFRIASAISDHYGIQLNKSHADDTEQRFYTAKDILSRTIYTKLCFHKQFSYDEALEIPLKLNLSGHGEHVREKWKFPSIDVFIERIVKSQVKRKGLSGQFAPLFESASKIIRSSAAELSKVYESAHGGVLPATLSQLLHLNTRGRLHNGLYSTGLYPVQLSPLTDQSLLLLKNSEKEEWKDTDLTAAVIYARYGEALLDFPIEGNRSIAPETMEYARELCEKYPRQVPCVNNHYDFAASRDSCQNPTDRDVELKRLALLYGITGEMWDSSKFNNKVEEVEVEAVFQRAFLSPTIQNAVVSLYGEDFYEAVLWSPAFMTWHPFQHWHTALSIGALQVVAEGSGHGGDADDIVDFISTCAEEVPKTKLEEVLICIAERRSSG